MILRCYKIFFLIVFYFITNVISAQNLSKVDSMVNLLRQVNDTNYIKLCIKISGEHSNLKKLNLGFNYADSALIRAKTIKIPTMEAKAYSHMGGL